MANRKQEATDPTTTYIACSITTERHGHGIQSIRGCDSATDIFGAQHFNELARFFFRDRLLLRLQYQELLLVRRQTRPIDWYRRRFHTRRSIVDWVHVHGSNAYSSLNFNRTCHDKPSCVAVALLSNRDCRGIDFLFRAELS